MKKRNRIGEYELEWLEPKSNVDPKAAARMERLKKTLLELFVYIVVDR